VIRTFLPALLGVAALLLPRHGDALEVSLSPDAPMAGDAAVVVFSTIGDRCVTPAPQSIAVHVEASVLVGEIEVADFCQTGGPQQEVELPLGAIPPQVRTLEVRTCGNAPAGAPRCSPVLVKGIAGGGVAAPTVIPAQSAAGLVVMAVAMLLLGLVFSPLTRRSSGS